MVRSNQKTPDCACSETGSGVARENRLNEKSKMAAIIEMELDLHNTEETERSKEFWTSSIIAVKSTVERQWIKSVRMAKRKPNYGMGILNSLHEEICGNKLELSGPLLDSYLRELGQGIKQKLVRSKATGLVSPIVLFIPFVVFKHFLPFTNGYGASIKQESTRDRKKCKRLTIEITKSDTAERIFSTERLSGENVLNYRKFKKDSTGTFQYYGKSAVVVTQETPITLLYNMDKQRVTLTCYVQRYNKDDFAVNTQLQALMNRQ